MPYWVSSSRVGVQPSPPNPKHANNNNKQQQQKRAERFGRKGITMEDLKKQTALRLAQEQSRQNQGRASYRQGAADVTVPRTSPPPPQAPPLAPYNGHDPYRDVQVPPPREFNGHDPYREQVPPPRDFNGHDPYREAPVPPSRDFSHDPYRDVQVPPPLDYNGHDPYRDAHQLAYQSRGPAPPAVHRGPEFMVPPPPVPSYSSIPNASFAEQKAKLPHGLTVQELKEMTKARLQAEAANKNQAGELITLHPTSARVPSTPEPKPGIQVMASPIPPGFAPRAEPSYVREEPRPENWDGMSRVLPSDAYLAQNYVPEPFDRTGSFEANRRRATTMSPRMGLSYPLHEEREVEDFAPRGRAFSSDPVPLNPRERAFSSDPYQSRDRAFSSDPYEPRERAFSSDPYDSREQAFSSDLVILQEQQMSGNVISMPQNRARTSSAASMPPISHTADEFGLDISEPFRFGAVREDAPVTPGLADVFRVSSFDKSPLSPQDNRMRASTWSAPSMFGVCGFDDLASILKLSGAEDKNQY